MHDAEDLPDTVLYVDDEDMACKYFERIAVKDMRVLVADSVDAALALLAVQAHRIGVVVTDYRMPGRDGGELLQQIEADYPQLVRILTTAYADKALILRTINAGQVFRILEKPLNMNEARTALRQARELAQARAADRRRLRAINETLAFLAHELNTPLATVLNFSRGIAQRAADGRLAQGGDDLAHATQSIDANARYCLAILSSFANSARAAAGSKGTAVAQFAGGESGPAASTLVESLLGSYPFSQPQRASLALAQEGDFLIPAMPNCVSLALSSLLTNALRALAGHAAPRLSIRIDGLHARICIRDNGPGIPDSVRTRLLADPVTTHAQSGGSGRGLLFCQRIMQSFGGSLAIASAPGACAVTLQFPARCASPPRSVP